MDKELLKVYLEKMQECVENDDYEQAHGRADDLLGELLEELGYGELVKKYDEVGKFYA